MENVIEIILRIYLWFCLAALLLYLPRVSYYFVALREQKKLKNSEKNKIAVIIPAKNESIVIRDCLNSFSNQTYPKEYFDVFVVIENEDDPTSEIAKNYENTFVTIVGNQTCKGDALDGVLKKILTDDDDKYDAYLIVDADNIATPNLLEEMNNALGSKKHIICGKKLIKNWNSSRRDSRSFVSNCTSLIYTLVDDLGNRARNGFGITITIIGTGLMVHKDIIKKNNGWPYRSLTEDYELTADAIVNNWTSMYYAHAKVCTEEATDRKTVKKRKDRWIGGYVQCKRKYRKKIFKKILSRNVSWRNLSYFVGTIPPGMFLGVSIVSFIFGLVAIGFGILSPSVDLYLALRMTWVPLVVLYGSLFVFTLAALLTDRSNIKISFLEKLAILFFHPFFTLGYLRAFILALFKRKKNFKWDTTTERIPFEKKED
ncbi:MAG: glycosyltransferase [Firmicutes bacterium]|nr:glycosyltransferase [Bacillota bacterium]